MSGGEDWDNVSTQPGTEFIFRARRSIVFDVNAVGLAFKCSTIDISEHYEWEYQGPNLVVTPKDSMFAGGAIGVGFYDTARDCQPPLRGATLATADGCSRSVYQRQTS